VNTDIAGSSLGSLNFFIGPYYVFFYNSVENLALIIFCDIFEVSTFLQTAGDRHELPIAFQSFLSFYKVHFEPQTHFFKIRIKNSL